MEACKLQDGGWNFADAPLFFYAVCSIRRRGKKKEEEKRLQQWYWSPITLIRSASNCIRIDEAVHTHSAAVKA